MIADFIEEQPAGTDTLETILISGDGERIPVELTVRAGVMEADKLVFAVRDIRDRIAREARIRHLALHDALTDLPNRRSFTERLAADLASVAPGERLALISIDLDGFKEINDLRGTRPATPCSARSRGASAPSSPRANSSLASGVTSSPP